MMRKNSVCVCECESMNRNRENNLYLFFYNFILFCISAEFPYKLWRVQCTRYTAAQFQCKLLKRFIFCQHIRFIFKCCFVCHKTAVVQLIKLLSDFLQFFLTIHEVIETDRFNLIQFQIQAETK